MGKCRSGDGETCRLVGGNFARGGSGPFGYFPQDDAKAAEFFSLGCNFGEPRSCGELGSALMEGKGIEKNPAKGMPLLLRSCNATPSRHCYEAASAGLKTQDEAVTVRLYKRGCGSGHQPSCQMVEYYEGTGVFSNGQPPVGALGYLFGMPMSDAAKNCASSGFKFTAFAKASICNGSQTAQNFSVSLDPCDGRVCTVLLVSVVAGGGVAAMRQYNDLEAELTTRYGGASSRKRSLPDGCKSDQTFGDCLKQGRVQMSAVWTWESKSGVTLTLRQHPDGSLGNTIFYSSALSSERSRGSGL